ncbi:UDP-glycosyltransferase 90A1-like [Telopea speciosissima]|uniref:UDP-glycosyltransferase 90A1-like n=1 Tax=Telopea speciosissima TaxID=54955 RepID=UPI001CC541B9|nr:UDP-glycosyltransferase 90A1-like [Telopea speciosissima]
MGSDLNSSVHIVLFPFMSKGHTIPMLQIARLLLLRRGITITIFTTHANSPFIRQSLSDTQPNVSVIELDFPTNIPELPPGIESTDQFPSMSLFIPFANATKLMQPDFEKALNNLSISGGVNCIISDGFLFWTQKSAEKFSIPRLVFYGMNNYVMTLCRILGRNRSHLKLGLDEPFTVPGFPSVKLTLNDFESPMNDSNPQGPHFEFIVETGIATSKSQGLVVNSFYELEPAFLDYWNREFVPKAWCVGPFGLVEKTKYDQAAEKSNPKPDWIKWLDQKSVEGRSVLYVAFGSQAEITKEQLREMAAGLERSEVSFLWVVRSKGSEGLEELEEKVKGRGLVVREWVDQVEILGHESVKGFMSHCGWNSALEGICTAVPILAWPMMAEQHLNARMVAEELGVGLRILGSNGSVRGFVGAEIVEKMVRELMEGEEGEKVSKKVKEVGEAARKAMEEGGSSWRTLDQLIDETCRNTDPTHLLP